MTAASRRARADLVRGRRAGLVSRLLADGVDLAVAAVILFGVLVTFAVIRYMVGAEPLQLPRVSGVFTAAAYPITVAVYLAAGWSGNGQSVGKKLVGLRIVRDNGGRVGPLRATTRAIICVVVGGLSLAWSIFSSRNAAVHDLLLHTSVVHDWSDEVHTRTDASSPSATVTAAPATAGTPPV